jgi:lysophospholipid acyltransferase (LPLAT)-like uncharacterized protein
MAVESVAPKPLTWKAYLAAFLIRGFTKLFCATYRIQIVEGADRYRSLLTDNKPVIVCAWHNRVFFLSYYLEKSLTRKGFDLTQMVSLSRDGNIGYLLGKWAKIKVVRGSSNRGGSKGLRNLFRAIHKDHSSILLLPDGSQGPVYKAKAGTIVLAQLSGAPLFLFSFSPDRAWRLKSWDRLIIPKPFAKISIRIPEPIQVARELSKEQLEKERLKLENALNELRS